MKRQLQNSKGEELAQRLRDQQQQQYRQQQQQQQQQQQPQQQQQQQQPPPMYSAYAYPAPGAMYPMGAMAGGMGMGMGGGNVGPGMAGGMAGGMGGALLPLGFAQQQPYSALSEYPPLHAALGMAPIPNPNPNLHGDFPGGPSSIVGNMPLPSYPNPNSNPNSNLPLPSYHQQHQQHQQQQNQQHQHQQQPHQQRQQYPPFDSTLPAQSGVAGMPPPPGLRKPSDYSLALGPHTAGAGGGALHPPPPPQQQQQQPQPVKLRPLRLSVATFNVWGHVASSR